MATTFPLFADKCLPEIQDLIWHHFIYQTGPRVLEMKIHADLTKSPNKKWDFSFGSSTPVPLALSVCSRSRHLAKRRWTLGLGAEGNQPQIWIDYGQDTLSFRKEHTRNYSTGLGEPILYPLLEFSTGISLVERTKLRNVQLQWESLFYINYMRHPESLADIERLQGALPRFFALFLLRSFPALEVLTLLHQHGYHDEYAYEPDHIANAGPIRLAFEEGGTKVEYVEVPWLPIAL